MNIFILDLDPSICARYHTDKHVVKMIVETAQLLCSAHTEPMPYKLSNPNHPCAVWTRKSLSNYTYLCDLGFALCKEFMHRFNKVHRTIVVLRKCKEQLPDIPDIGLTPFAQAMPDEYVNVNPVTAYRDYYNGDKSRMFKWTKRDKPDWIIDATN